MITATAHLSVYYRGVDWGNLTADQNDFVGMVIDYPTEHGIVDPRSLYESQFTDINTIGLDDHFESSAVIELLQTIEDMKKLTAA